MKIGDKVRFLSEVGGGIVTGNPGVGKDTGKNVFKGQSVL